MNTKCLEPSLENIKLCADALASGQVVAFPTETVYGLGASLFQPKAIDKIFHLKKRPSDNPLIVHISNLDEVSKIAKKIPKDFYFLAEKFFPGPLTVVLEAKEIVPRIATANKDTIAIRMPNNECALRLIEYAETPLVAPSANLSGKPSSTKAAHVIEDFNNKIPYVLDGGDCNIGIESTVVLLEGDGPCLLRPGSISPEEIELCLNKKVKINKKEHNGCSPGMKYRHYAPDAFVFLKKEKDIVDYHFIKPLFLSSDQLSGTKLLTRQNLYELFRFADRNKFQEVVIVDSDSLRRDNALFNRIEKAIKRK